MRTTSTSVPLSVIDRFLAVLEAVRRANGRCTLSGIAAETGIPKSSASRLVAGLVAQGYLTRHEGGVAVGLRLFELGARTRTPHDLGNAATPILAELSRATGEHLNVAVREGADMVSIAAVPGRLRPLPSRPGGRVPSSTTALGKAVLAFAGDEAVTDVTSPLTSDARAHYLRELAEVRLGAVAIDQCTTFPNVVGVASPILGPDGAAIAALSVSGPASDMDADRMKPLVRRAARLVARRLIPGAA